jgi:hypothetical protein
VNSKSSLVGRSSGRNLSQAPQAKTLGLNSLTSFQSVQVPPVGYYRAKPELREQEASAPDK